MKEKKKKGIVEEEDSCVGFNLPKQKLHCLIALNDDLGSALSGHAGTAYFRAFVVEDRKTGEIFVNQRFRYKTGDSWSQLRASKDKQHLSVKEKVEYLAGGIEKVMRMGLEMVAKRESPKDAVVRFYPPEPDDSEKTLDWLIAQDLVQITEITSEDGRVVYSGSKEGQA
jgi:hypothetical protein